MIIIIPLWSIKYHKGVISEYVIAVFKMMLYSVFQLR